MALQLSSTANQDMSGQKIAIFGGAGSGKTRVCATAPTPIILNAEKTGTKSIRDFDIPSVAITSYAEAWEAIKWLQTCPDYATVCVDSISQIAEQHIQLIKPNYKNLMQAYGQLADDMVPLINAFMALPQNVVLCSQVSSHKDEVTQITKFVPHFPGQALPTVFPHLVDAIWYLGTEQLAPSGIAGQRPEIQRVLHTSATPQFDCKDRSGVLEAKYIVPDMPRGENSLLLTNLFAAMAV